jgi:hypothetical protein
MGSKDAKLAESVLELERSSSIESLGKDWFEGPNWGSLYQFTTPYCMAHFFFLPGALPLPDTPLLPDALPGGIFLSGAAWLTSSSWYPPSCLVHFLVSSFCLTLPGSLPLPGTPPPAWSGALPHCIFLPGAAWHTSSSWYPPLLHVSRWMV